jgi:hypothetical protein
LRFHPLGDSPPKVRDYVLNHDYTLSIIINIKSAGK